MGVTRDRLLEELPYMNRALMRMPVTFYGEKSIQSGTKSPKFSEMPASFCGEELTAAGRAENEITVEESRTQERENTAGSENAGDDPIKKLPPGIGTDGRLVYADIDEVICAYRENRIRLSRTYLHMIFHCLFQHPFRCRRMDRRRWNFAADAAAEDAVLSLGIAALQMEDDWQLKAKLDLMKQAVGEPFTAERIYHYLRTHSEPFDVEHAAQNTSRQADWTQSDRTQSDRIQSDRTRGEDDFPDAWAEDASIFHRDIHEPWLFIIARCQIISGLGIICNKSFYRRICFSFCLMPFISNNAEIFCVTKDRVNCKLIPFRGICCRIVFCLSRIIAGSAFLCCI